MTPQQQDLARWFKRWPSREQVFPLEATGGVKWQALAELEALVWRDAVLERMTPALAAELERAQGWMPVVLVAGKHVVLHDALRGLTFHEDGKSGFQPSEASRAWAMDELLWLVPELRDKPFRRHIVPFDWAQRVSKARSTGRNLNPRPARAVESRGDFPAQLLALGYSEDTGLEMLVTWFSVDWHDAFHTLLSPGEHVLGAEEAMKLRATRRREGAWLPLVEGDDGTWVAFIPGLGVAQWTSSGLIVPMTRTLSGWVEHLIRVAAKQSAAFGDGPSITRDTMGKLTFDAGPMTAPELAAALERLPLTIYRNDFTLTFAAASRSGVRATREGQIAASLDGALVRKMTDGLRAVKGPAQVTLEWEELPDLQVVVRGT